MQLELEIINVGKPVPAPTGKWQSLDVAYRNNGKIEGKNLKSFVNAQVFKDIQTKKEGDVILVNTEKDAKGYWQWTKITDFTAVESKAEEAKPATKGSYETKEERALRQQMIIRQSSLSSAVEFHTGKKSTIEDVLYTATMFVDWVNEKEVRSDFDDLDSAAEIIGD